MFRSSRVAQTEGESYRVAARAPWSPAQLVVAAAGILYVVIGGAALARAGLHFDNVPLTRTLLAGLWFTNMSALITLVAGVIMLVGAIDPDSAKATMWFFGVILIAFGLIVPSAPRRSRTCRGTARRAGSSLSWSAASSWWPGPSRRCSLRGAADIDDERPRDRVVR
jgi:hypothetical protein